MYISLQKCSILSCIYKLHSHFAGAEDQPVVVSAEEGGEDAPHLNPRHLRLRALQDQPLRAVLHQLRQREAPGPQPANNHNLLKSAQGYLAHTKTPPP